MSDEAEILTEDDLQNDPVEDSDQQTILNAGIIGPQNLLPVWSIEGAILGLISYPQTVATANPGALGALALPKAIPGGSTGDNQAAESSTPPQGSESQESADLKDVTLGPNKKCIDRWQTGECIIHFAKEEISGFKDPLEAVKTDWAMRDFGGILTKDNGTITAETPEEGYRAVKKCLGLLVCSLQRGDRCKRIQVRPAARPENLKQQQENEVCISCDARLRHITCKVKQTTIRYANGLVYKCTGEHLHGKPVPIHFSEAQTRKLEEFIKNRGNKKALPLAVGELGPLGMTGNLVDISELHLNVDRTRYEIRRIRNRLKKNSQDDYFFEQTERFHALYPGFCTEAYLLNGVIVFCFQSQFMAEIACDTSPDAAARGVDGFVTDGAHKYFRGEKSILISTCRYCEILHGWVPILFSYANGQSAEHYAVHFFALMRSVYEMHVKRKLPFSYKFFANVVDFSSAQRSGFVKAFTRFYKEYYDRKTPNTKLEEFALSLLKGCEFHYKEGVRRVKRSGAIPIQRQAEYETLAYRLLKVTDPAEFDDLAERIVAEFPLTKNWMDWWRDPRNAGMIFASQLKMDRETYEATPATTNADESVHSMVYQAWRTDCDYASGCIGLREVSRHIEQKYDFRLRGGKLHHGPDEKWKDEKELTGTTHPERSVGFIKRKYPNDGRPPDSAATLYTESAQITEVEQDTEIPLTKKPKITSAVVTSPVKGKLKRTSSKKASKNNNDNLYSFTLERNSCWIDVSLETLYHFHKRDPVSLDRALSGLPVNSILRQVLTIVQLRQKVSEQQDPQLFAITVLGAQRNNLRFALLEAKTIRYFDAQSSLLGWLDYAISRPNTSLKVGLPYDTERYFAMQVLTIRNCLGNGAPHMLIDKFPQQKRYLPCSKDQFKDFGGDAQNYLQFLANPISNNATTTSQLCWRKADDGNGCGCNASEKTIIMSHPICLAFEIRDDPIFDSKGDPIVDSNGDVITEHLVWNFPPTILFFLGEKEFHYDIVARAYHGKAKSHFTAAMVDSNNDSYTYDNMDGVLKPSHVPYTIKVAGPQSPCDGFRTNVVYYHLRGGYETQNELSESTKEILHRTYSISVTPSSNALLRAPNTVLPRIHLRNDNFIPVDEDVMKKWNKKGNRFHAQDYDHCTLEAMQKPMTDRFHMTDTENEVDESSAHIEAVLPKDPIDVSIGYQQLQEVTKVLLSGEGSSNVVLNTDVEALFQCSIGSNVEVSEVNPQPVQPESPIYAQKSQAPLKKSSSQLSVGENEEWMSKCRCGAMEKRKGPTIEEVLVQCSECGCWSHAACQLFGYTTFLDTGDPFYCHDCMAPSMGNQDQPHFTKELKAHILAKMEERGKGPKEGRMWPGKGVLVRSPVDKKYWIPARVITCPEEGQYHPTWTVKLWRHCFFKSGKPESLVIRVEINNIEDELWHQQAARRRIRLGKFKHAYEIPRVDNVLANYPFTPYSEKINSILEPHLPTFKKILLDKAPLEKVAVLRFLVKDDVPDIEKKAVLYATGDLDVITQGEVVNWLALRLPRGSDPERIRKWFQKECMAHAMTLVMAEKHNIEDWGAVLRLLNQVSLERSAVDVDRECLYEFEKRLFDTSEKAGVAGNRQWGLSEGAHQYRWDPYFGTDHYFPESNYIYQEVNEEDYQRGRHYSEGSEPEANLMPITKRKKARARQAKRN